MLMRKLLFGPHTNHKDFAEVHKSKSQTGTNREIELIILLYSSNGGYIKMKDHTLSVRS